MVIGVIGGSGLYEMEGLTGVREVKIDTPFGEPSDAYITIIGSATIKRGAHRFCPKMKPVLSKANIFEPMKKRGS